MAPLNPGIPPALKLLVNRRSVAHLVAPGPDDEELGLMLHAVAHVPDFQHLRPYRFLFARDSGLTRLGAAMQRAAMRIGKSADDIQRAAHMPNRAPLVAVAVFSPKPSAVVPVIDQQYCAGCAALTLQLAANALGYAGIWRTGWPASAPAFRDELQLKQDESIVGFLYLGTAPDAPSASASTPIHNLLSPDGITGWL
jgi:nitroreductase